MRLSYRGASYEYTPLTLEVTESEILGKYRKPFGEGQISQAVSTQPLQELKYRGVTYTTDRSDQVGAMNSTKPQSLTEPLVRPVTVQTARSISAINAFCRNRTAWAEVHRHNLMQNLEHRIQVAKERADQNLVNQLEREMHHLA
ncbi:MAG: DUF4278 domain-containing protein [Scytolyngbya sp. HA4215-MV1]|nr:DUF4278 domain-containing protein [Scytolyngbya sp. HA4215-MV1]